MKVFGEVRKFIHRNRSLSVVSIGSLIIVLLYYIFIAEIPSVFEKWFLLVANLCTGLLVNLGFYIFQVYIPELNTEKKSLILISPQLKLILERLEDIIQVSQKYIGGIETGDLHLKDKKIVYFMRVNNGDSENGWARKFDFSKDCTRLIHKINAITNDLSASNPFQRCANELIETIYKIQNNN